MTLVVCLNLSEPKYLYLFIFRPTWGPQNQNPWGWGPISPLLECATCKAVWVVLILVWSWSLGVLFLGSFGRGSLAGQGQTLPVTGPELPGRYYKSVCAWLLPLLDLEACWGGLTVEQGWLPPVLDLGQLNKRHRAALDLCHLLAAYKVQLYKEPP